MRYQNWIVPFLVLILIAPSAWAARVFLNGVEITGLKGRTFNKATVVIDDAGDVRIDAPQYEVRPSTPPDGATAPAPPPKASVLTRQYFLTVQGNALDAQYDIAIKVNGVERKFIPTGSAMVIDDISEWFAKGDNTVVIIASKNLGESRRSNSERDQLTVLIGTGRDNGGMVKIDTVKAKFQCDASQLSDITRTFQIVAE